MYRIVFTTLWAMLVLATLCAPPVVAQSRDTMPRLSGTITDTTGAALPGAAVDLLLDGRVVRTATAGDDGRYVIEPPMPGDFTVRVRLSGFSAAETSVRVRAAAEHDVALRVAPLRDRVVVTASRTPQREADALQSVTVLDSPTMAAAGATSVGDALRLVPGLAVESTGREGSLTALFSRGGESDHTLVLIDGVRVNGSGGRFDAGRVSVADVERVEIVRGAQSALYGSDAMGGVVQIFTRRAGASDRPRADVTAEGGRFGTWRAGANLAGGARNRADYQAGVSYRGTDGAFADRLPERDRFDQVTFNLGGGFVAGPNVHLRSGLRTSRARGRAVGPIAFGSRDTGTAYDTRDLSWRVEAEAHTGPRIRHTAQFVYYGGVSTSADRVADDSYTVFALLEGEPGARYPSGPALVRFVDAATYTAVLAGRQPVGAGRFVAITPFGVSDFVFNSETRFRRPAAKYQAEVAWRPGQTLVAGYEYERESNPLARQMVIANHAVFAQQRLSLGRSWSADLGARVDANDRYGTSTSPRLSVGGYPRPFSLARLSSLKLFASAGRGIKNPVFDELYGSAFVDGNPDLRPERAWTFDAGSEVTLFAQRYRARATFFYQTYRDQVAYRGTAFSPDGKPDYVNIEGTRARGLELELALQRPVAGLTAEAGYALTASDVTATVSGNAEFQTGQPLLRRPRQGGSFRVGYAARRLGLTMTGRLVGQRHDASFLGLSAPVQPGILSSRTVDITRNPGYVVVGIGADLRLTPQLAWFARADNVANVAYQSALGYPGLPRSVMTGARLSLGGGSR